METIRGILTPDAQDKRQLGEIVSGAKLAAKVAASIVAVAVIGSVVVTPFGFVAMDMIGDALNAIWGKK